MESRMSENELVGRVKRVRKVTLYTDDDGVEIFQSRVDIAMIGDEDYEKAEKSLDGCRVMYDRILDPPGTHPQIGDRIVATLQKGDVWSPEAEWVFRKAG